MSGTSLVILALYATFNVTGPAGARLDPAALPMVLSALGIAAVLAVAALYLEGSQLPRRRASRNAPLPLRRVHGGPRPRRS